ncbi:hypothetical protein EPUS_06488 [Endocarpon pusillum Z07020]|uniref:B30.2/SPRY domain-containing protein n=1 Tax=Endocarpon pusillum (strain Z07020 / HMAS-L-300199) TaxID=1263415 RepID=U1HRY7_ENDPU|nr:uncharacterized protein EPUS_06488 [Endocarpon pusillum Z07020]ERF71929.1 hypothetical protein EPUS_06488 [Endocarpon pusillum Z07020]
MSPNTLRWLLLNDAPDAYLSWSKSNVSALLYIHGLCGVGKSFISSFLWEHLRSGSPGNGSTVIYFSFEKDDLRRTTTRSMLLSFIHQLLTGQPRTFLSIRTQYESIRQQLPWTIEELWMFFRAMICSPVHQELFCIIDAMDQADSSISRNLLDIIRFCASRNAKVKMIATSRIQPGLQSPLLFTIDLGLQSKIKMDVETVGREHAQHLIQGSQAFVGLEKELVEHFQSLSTHLEGSFSFKSLGRSGLRSSRKAIREELASLALSTSCIRRGLTSDILKLSGQDRTALFWILLSCRPLTCNELSIASSIREGNTTYLQIQDDIPRDIARDLSETLSPIIFTQHEEIHIVHPSMKDVLLTLLKEANKDSSSTPELAHADLTRLCLTYLAFTDFGHEDLPESVNEVFGECLPVQQYGFLEYATEYWPEHYRRTEDRCSLSQDVLRFFKKECFKAWNRRRGSTGRPGEESRPSSASPLQVAAELGFIEILKELLDSDANAASLEDKIAALESAAEKGHLEIAELLLIKGASSARALTSAVQNGNTKLVKQLISEISVRESQDGKVPDFHLAALRGHVGVMKALVEAAPDSEFLDNNRYASLRLVCQSGQLAVLRYLLKDHKLERERAPALLHAAAKGGHLEIVQDLIKAGADPNAADNDNHTALQLAAEGGYVLIVRELIKLLDPDVKDAALSSALHSAAKEGHLQVVDELVIAGVALDAREGKRTQPIHQAAQGGHLKLLKRLLELEVNPLAVDEDDFTPLHLAAREGHLPIVLELLNNEGGKVTGEIDLESAFGSQAENVEKNGEDLDESFVVPETDGATEEDKMSDDSSRNEDADAGKEGKDDEDESSTTTGTDKNSETSSSGVDYEDDNDPDRSDYPYEITPLHSAARRGHVEIVKALLGAGAELEKPNIRQMTPLYLAAQNGHATVVDCLLQKGADANAIGGKDATPLHLAISTGNISIVKALLQAGAEVNASNRNGDAPVHMAVYAGRVDVVKELLKFGADVRRTDNEGQTPLHLAAAGGHSQIVKQLFEAGSNPELTDSSGNTALHIAAKEGHSSVVRELLAKGVNLSTKSRNGWTALHFSHHSTEVTNQLLKAGAVVDATNNIGSTALFLAAYTGCEPVVKALLKAEAKADKQNIYKSTPIHRAAEGGYVGCIKLLIEAGANPLQKKRSNVTPVQLALSSGHPEAVEQLLEPMKKNSPPISEYEETLVLLARRGFENGVKKVLEHPLLNLDSTDSLYGQSPLSHAAENGHEGIVRLLLQKGANPNSTDLAGRSPLSWAALNGREAVVQLLLDKGANADLSDNEGWNALHLAVADNCESIVKLLLEKGVGTSATLKSGYTALDLAVNNSSPDMVRLLVDSGASMSTRTKYQFSPLDMAVRDGDLSVARALLDLGAEMWVTGPDGHTPLDIALYHGHQHIVDLFLEHNVNSLGEEQGLTKLHLAMLSGNKKSMQEFLDQGGDINCLDKNGMTALHLAAARSDEDLVLFLLGADADVGMKDNEGMTPLHRAVMEGNETIVRALLSKGADVNAVDLHVWTPFHLAKAYGNVKICDVLSESGKMAVTSDQGEVSISIPPSRFIKAVSSSDITISEDGLTATTENVTKMELAAGLQIRADHPIPPGANTYYFEVAFVHAARESAIAVGFCEADSRRIGMPGWHRAAWGYHGDDGALFNNKGLGTPYGPKYAQGDVVGCAIDFTSKSAFFTKNGDRVGEVTKAAFTNVVGRLFPVVGIGDAGIKVVANFGPNDFHFKDFK